MKTAELLKQIPGIQKKITELIACLAVYEGIRLMKENYLYPEHGKQILSRQLAASTDPAEQLALQQQLAALDGPGGRVLSQNIRAELWQKFEPARVALGELVDLCIPEVAKLRQQAVEPEKQFFASQGLPHESTSASRRFDHDLNRLGELREGVERYRDGGNLPSVTGIAVLHFFGMTDII